ncbi:hypothetical protein Ciccas_002905 [Cichlidogyrus casuarinus]|uniref:Uncharacterized protein n=1 Tax=Cichlidogyrus casuarinus TaxID=1844966 RepID=A0ABD2QFX1_9PLAT
MKPSALSFSALQLQRSPTKGACLTTLVYKSQQENFLGILEKAFSGNEPFRIFTHLQRSVRLGLLPELEADFYEELTTGKIDVRNLDTMTVMCGRDQIGCTLAQELQSLVAASSKSTADLLLVYLQPEAQEIVEEVHQSKRRRLTEDIGESHDPQLEFHSRKLALSSIPWLILCNFLLETNNLSLLKKLPALAERVSSDPFFDSCTSGLLEEKQGAQFYAQPRVQSRWIWLSLQRLRLRFDALTQSTLYLPSLDSPPLPYYDIAKIHTQVQTLKQLAQFYVQEHRAKRDKVSVVRGNALKRSRDDSLSCESMRLAEDAFLQCTAIYASYTNIVCLFLKCGLLRGPSLQQEEAKEVFLVAQYNYELFSDHLKPVEGEEVLRDRLTLTQSLLQSLFRPEDQFTGASLAQTIWRQHEDLQPQDPVFYPPKRVQSICALWQLPTLTRPDDHLRLFSLTIFLLLDAFMLQHCANQDETSLLHNDSSMRDCSRLSIGSNASFFCLSNTSDSSFCHAKKSKKRFCAKVISRSRVCNVHV